MPAPARRVVVRSDDKEDGVPDRGEEPAEPVAGPSRARPLVPRFQAQGWTIRNPAFPARIIPSDRALAPGLEIRRAVQTTSWLRQKLQPLVLREPAELGSPDLQR